MNKMDIRGGAMSEIVLEHRENIAVVRLNNGVTHAISPGMVEDLSGAIKKARGGSRGILLAGGEKFFSIGFDLPALLTLDRSGMTDFFYQFNEMVFDLYTMPLPTVCAICGHAIAGGTILALPCDYRIAEPGKKLIGLNEIKLGLPVPYLADLMLRQIVGDRVANDMLYYGEFVTCGEAERTGLIDEVLPREMAEGVEDRAWEKVVELATLSQPAFGLLKANRSEPVRSRYEKNVRTRNESFLDQWFSQPVQDRLAAAAQKF
jgi:enoyl-CoA hydratase/carnithine racemase